MPNYQVLDSDQPRSPRRKGSKILGIRICAVKLVVFTCQVVLQDNEKRKRHRELFKRLDELESSLASRD